MDNPRDWPKDFPHENGNYAHVCLACKNAFLGHKYRRICKICAGEHKLAWDALSPTEQEAATKKNHEEVRKMLDEFNKKWQS